MPTPKCVLLGAGTLLGRELRDLTARVPFASDLRLIDTGSSGSEEAEADPIANLDEDSLAGAGIVFLAACDPASRQAARKALGQKPVPHLIDVPGVLEDEPSARLRAPSVEAGMLLSDSELHTIAHPASIALALFLTRLRKAASVTRAVIQIFEPASERGQAGIDVLQKQTVSLLSFKPLPKDIYDAQL